MPKMQWKRVPTPPKLRRLSNAEFDLVYDLAEQSGTPLRQCPTCGSLPEEIAPDVFVAPNGEYKLHGEVRECDCETQIALRKHYLLANVGDQYMRLDWNENNRLSERTKNVVKEYLEKWDSFKRNGMGLEFTSKKLGTGKTFAATYVARELIKRGERVFFIPFLEIISAYNADNRHELENRLKNTTVLVLDEVVPPNTQAQAGLFAAKFEELIRHRTNFNKPTVMTTNLEPAKLRATYPRPYSLLEAKQVRVPLDGEDARVTFINEENLELAMNEEIRPIT